MKEPTLEARSPNGGDFSAKSRGAMWRTIIWLSLPIIGSSLSQNIFNLVDSAMVGRLGPAALAACGMGGMISWVLVSALGGLSVGVQSIAARRHGEGENRAAVKTLNSALFISLFALPIALLAFYFSEPIFRLFASDEEVVRQGAPYLAARILSLPFAGINFAFAGYFNGVHKTSVHLKAALLTQGLNVVFNYILIFGFWVVPSLGTLGAGIGTALASIVCSIIYLYFAAREGFLALIFRISETSQEITKAIFKISYPICFQQVSLSASLLVFFWIAVALGTRELAATNIILKIGMLCILPCVGFGTAAASLVSSALGAGDRLAARRWGRETIYIGALYTLFMAALFALWPRFWLSLFVDDAQTIEIGALPLVVFTFGAVVDGMGIIFSRALIGAGDSRAVAAATAALHWFLFIPLCWISAAWLGGGIIGLWLSFVVYRFTFTVIMLIYFRESDWEKIVI